MTRPQEAVFSAIADPTRREILTSLASGDAHVAQLAKHFRISRPAVSRHLRVLRDAGLVGDKRVGRMHVYTLRPRPLQRVRIWVAQFDKFWGVKLKTLKSRLGDVR